MYNKYILKPINNSQEFGPYHFTDSVAHLLGLLSGVDKKRIKKTKIYQRSLFRYLPWYKAINGGGAITLASQSRSSITFTENFFSSDKTKYNHKAYLNNIFSWLRLASHEVGHIQHGVRYKFFLYYLIVFGFQYLRYGHDNAPLEKEADIGSQNFIALVAFCNSKYKANIINDILSQPISEDKKIILINDIWSTFQNEC